MGRLRPLRPSQEVVDEERHCIGLCLLVGPSAWAEDWRNISAAGNAEEVLT